MKLITGILLCIGVHCTAQSDLQWKKLPTVQGTEAYINKRKALIDTIIPKEPAPRVKELYKESKLEFISIVVPDTLEHIKYKSYPLNWTKKETLPNGMIFKDEASFNIKYLDKGHGLPGNSVSSIAEDKDGLIYMTSTSGLLVLNGSEITIYGDHPHFAFTSSKSLFYDQNGKMWIASDEQVGFIYENKLYLPEKPIFGGVHQQPFREHENGDFFISTNYNGLYIVKEDYLLHYEKGLPHNMITDAILTSENKLWIGFARHGVGYIQNDSLFAFKELGNYGTTRAFLECEGELWIGNFSAPLLKYRNDSLFTVKLEVVTNYVYTLEQNSKGIWFTDYSYGLFLIKPNGEYYFFNKNNGLIDRNAYDLFIDSYENVWVADLLNGVSRVDENFFHLKANIPHIERINEIECDNEGNCWNFRNGRFLVKETSKNYIRYKNESDSEFPVLAHCLDGFVKNDEVWMGSYGQGIISLQNMDFTFYQLKGADYFDNSMRHLQCDSYDRIWTITENNQLQYLLNGRFYNLSIAPEWKDYQFVSTEKMVDGTFFVTTRRNGVIQIKDDQYRKVVLSESPNSKYISKIFRDSSDDLWFFMNGEVQVRKPNGSIIRVENQVFIDNPLRDVVEVTKNHFLGVSSNGIVSIIRNSSELEVTLYDRSEGLYMVDNVTIHQNKDGEIIIANSNGIVVCDSSLINTKPPPKLSFNRLVINDSTEVDPHGVKIEQQKSLEYVFNVINWGSKSQLYYILERNGQSNTKWNSIAGNTIRFNELTFGNYVLKVYAQGRNSKSTVWETTFVIQPYWYQTIWFFLFIFFSISGLIIGYFLFKQRKTSQDKKKLEAQVAERTEELVHEKERVLRQLEEKEVLRQEVHHRVKNNLTFLKSLLFLRSRASTSEEVKIILDECQARIQTMALVHQNLYDVDDTVDINFSSFIKELFVELHTLFETNKAVGIQIETGNIKMDMKSSIFIGLILNELITNSFKYAFDNIEKPIIYVQVTESESWTYLEYWDNGLGLEEGFDITKTKGFGFKIMNILVQQTDATLEYIGQKFLLTIPKNK